MVVTKRIFLGIILATSLFPNRVVLAGTLSPEALYIRCFAQLTGYRAPRTEAGRISVRQNEKPAIRACMELLQRSTLNSSGRMKNGGDSLAFAVLNNMYDVHRTWFSVRRFEEGVPSPDARFATYDLYDATQPALHLTSALLHPGKKFSEVVTSDTLLAGARGMAASGNPFPTITPYSRTRFPNFASSGLEFPFFASGNYKVVESLTRWSYPETPIAAGELVGIVAGSEVFNLNFAIPKVYTTPDSEFFVEGKAEADGNVNSGLELPLKMYSNFGGGIIGLREYLMLNMGHDYSYSADGAVGLPRRWAKNVLSDMLCRELPALRFDDVESFIVKDDNPKTPSFRKGTSCLRCHVSQDTLAGAARNLRWVSSTATGPDNPLSEGMSSAHLASYKVLSSAKDSWSPVADPNFRHQQPLGSLYYRSFDGTLVNEQGNGIGEIGRRMAETNDLYVCAAKKYFRHFTGIDVSLHDEGDPINESVNSNMSDRAWEARRFVIKLGLALKSHQSLTKLIEDIMASTYYQQSDFGWSEKQ